MALGIVSRHSKVTEHITVMDTVPYIELIKIIKGDISELSDKKYSFKEIRSNIQKRRDEKAYCKDYIKEIYNDIYENITNKGLITHAKSDDLYITGYLKSIQYDFNRLLDYITGECYILKIKSDTPNGIFKDMDFSIDISDTFLEECESLTLCVQLDNNKFSNLIFDLGQVGINGSLSYRQQHTNEPMYRLSVSAIEDDEVILLSEYEFFKSEYNRMFSLTKTGCNFCNKKCPNIDANIKITYEFNNQSQLARFGYDYYCEVREDHIKDNCIASSINPFNILGMMSYVYDRKHTQSDKKIVDMKSKKEDKKNLCNVAEILPDKTFEEYKIISVTPNYHYGESEYQGGTHASPIPHYRRGTDEITNKFGTTYSRRGTMVNNHLNQETK